MNKKSPRLQKLDNWLFEKMGARCLWQQSDGTRLVEGYFIRGRVVIVIRYEAMHDGFDIYTGTKSNNIDDTFAEIEKRLSIVSADLGQFGSEHAKTGR